MANVYDASGADSPRGPRVLAAVPEPRMSAEAITQPMKLIAEAVGAAGKTIEDATAQWQQQAGAASVTRGPDGEIRMETRPFELGRGDREANAAARQGALAMFQNDYARGAADLHAKNQTDPSGFLVSAKAFTNELITKLPKELRPLGLQHAESLVTQHHVAIQNTAANAATTNEKVALSTQLERRINELTQLSRHGGTSTPEFERSHDQMRDLYGALVRNPRFGVPQAKADEDIARIGETMKYEAVVGQADRAFDQRGAVGARETLRQELAKPGSHLTDADRARITAAFESRIGFREGQRKQEVSVNRQSIDALVEATTKGKPIPSGAWEAPLANADRLGDTEGATKGKMYRMLFGEGGALSGAYALPDAARDVLRGGSVSGPRVGAGGAPAGSPGGPAVPVTAAAAGSGATLISGAQPTVGAGFSRPGEATGAGLLRKFEGFRTTPYWDVNALRTGYGSDTITRSDGSVVRVTAGMQVSREDAERDLERRINTEFLPKAAQAVGTEAWGRLSQGAQEAMVSVTYNYGSLPSGVAAAARTGDANAIAAAIRGLGGHNGGVNADRRNKEAAHVLGASGPGTAFAGGAPRAGVPGPLAGNPYALPAYLSAAGVAEDQKVKFVSSLADSVLTGLKHGQLPSPEHGALIEQVASQHPGGEIGKKALEIASQLAGAQIAEDIGGGSAVTAQQRLSEIRSAAQGGSVWDQMTARATEEWTTRREKRMREDAITAGAEDRRWYPRVAPLNFATPETIARGVAEHGAAALAIASHQKTTGEPAFSGAGLEAVKDKLSNGDLGQRLAILQAVAQLPPEVAKATFGKLANDEEGRVFAIAGSVARFAPDVAKDIVVGRAQLQDDKKLAPKDDATLAEAFGKRLPLTDLPSEARAAIKSAALALYARGSTKANDTSTSLNEARLDKALSAVTGGLLDSGEGKVIAPSYGATQGDFDGLIRGLTDDDFAGARLSDGSRFPASAVKPSWFSSGWRLMSYGEGTYLVVSGSREEPRPLMQSMTDTSGAGGGPFILDLTKRAKPAAPTPRSASSVMPTWPAVPVDMP